MRGRMLQWAGRAIGIAEIRRDLEEDIGACRSRRLAAGRLRTHRAHPAWTAAFWPEGGTSVKTCKTQQNLKSM